MHYELRHGRCHYLIGTRKIAGMVRGEYCEPRYFTLNKRPIRFNTVQDANNFINTLPSHERSGISVVQRKAK